MAEVHGFHFGSTRDDGTIAESRRVRKRLDGINWKQIKYEIDRICAENYAGG